MNRLHDWLTFQAECRPHSTAVVYRGESTSFADLEDASNRLARALRAVGCTRGDRVALLLPKSTRALAAIFAALKADCIYVPIDTSSPVARIRRILHECECRCVLADQSTATLVKELVAAGALSESTRLGWLDQGVDLPMDGTPFRLHGCVPFNWKDVQQLPGTPVESLSEPSDPAHILFTSGSTGAPKGVVITHGNVIHFVRWAVGYFGMNAQDRVSSHPPLHFDLSTFDIYGSVVAGAQLHLVPLELNLLPHKLAAFIRDNQLTQWFSVPSALHQMAKFDAVRENDFPALKRVLWCGEKFPTPALMYWMKRLPHATFDNLYGPTETTIASSCYRVPRCPDSETEEISIGPPCRGELLLVLNEEMLPATPGETGDLYIGGVGLSPGYWNDPEKTRQVFLPNPYSANPSDRLYKTGDLAKICADGMIYLVGRADSQIKSRGYRIELGEIEAALHAAEGVQDAAVVALDAEGFGNKTLCCAYVPFPGADLPPIALKSLLALALPRYMMPERWMVLDRLPRNGNGKTDRPLLKQRFQQEVTA